jgi:hypothetical protein
MRPEDFDKLVDERLGFCKRTLQLKANEYATSDRLHNFKRAGKMQGCTPARALSGMWAKHIISILDIIDSIERGNVVDGSILSEKLTDNINYLLLLEAVICDTAAQNLTEGK